MGLPLKTRKVENKALKYFSIQEMRVYGKLDI